SLLSCLVSCVSVMTAIFCFFLLLICPSSPRISTLSLHDALPIFYCVSCDAPMSLVEVRGPEDGSMTIFFACPTCARRTAMVTNRSEEHTSELQSRVNIVCRIMLEKNNNINLQYYCKIVITYMINI